MLSTDARAVLVDFFTGDEHRFKVLKNFDDDAG
jgi:hypothetical protein